MSKKELSRTAITAIAVMSDCAMAMAQAPPAGGKGPGGGGGRGPARPVLSITSTAWPGCGGGPMHNAGARGGDNKSPQFEFHWSLGATPADAPATLKTYAIIFHDIENVGPMNTTTDTLHWSAFNIPGTAKSLPEGLGSGVLADGTTNGPGIASRGGTAPGAYFGPGA